MKPDLSIITINYNNAEGLLKTIKSLLAQNFTAFEFLVIDGASNDSSIDVIEKFCSNINFWVSEKDNGIYDAMNKGVKVASSPYLMFLNSGDTFAGNETLKTCISKIRQNPDVDVFYGDIYGSKSNGSEKWEHKHPPQLTLSFFESQNINHQASLVKANLFQEIGLYPEKYKLAGDHWFFLKCFLTDRRFYHINEPLVNYVYDGVSSAKRKLYEQEMEIMWREEVPSYVCNLLDENRRLHFELNTRFMRKTRKLKDLLKRIMLRQTNSK